MYDHLDDLDPCGHGVDFMLLAAHFFLNPQMVNVCASDVNIQTHSSMRNLLLPTHINFTTILVNCKQNVLDSS